MPARIERARDQPGAGPLPVRLDVEPQRVGAVGHRGARVHEEFRHVGRTRPPRPLIDGERRAHPLPRKPRHGVRTLPLRRGGTVPVPHRDRHLIDARWDGDELLVDHALVAAHRLLEGAHAHRLVARELAHGAGVGAEGDLHVVMRGERGAIALEAQRVIRERQAEHGERRVGRGGRDVVERRDERERRSRDQQAHGAVHRAGIEQSRDGRARLRPRSGSRPLCGTARRHTGREDGHCCRSSHLLNLKSGR